MPSIFPVECKFFSPLNNKLLVLFNSGSFIGFGLEVKSYFISRRKQADTLSISAEPGFWQGAERGG